jgi:hypothetical protein
LVVNSEIPGIEPGLREVLNITPEAFCDDIRWVIGEIKNRLILIPEIETVRINKINKCVSQWEESLNNFMK